ncbi:hypothetical protein FISHEDRAFT_73263 [Fistulina hepatica ATCC 64428]|uniref:Uncharacterized protein n=1 Tax=Fistulina hepatica ATCC 64428 TaxID=1128425 RepID=A0A0D7AEK2_9AGAR|nr:hypothetical protein FISHEDRAFT_73263 [Fistulina hepatica ATCC 64428]
MPIESKQKESELEAGTARAAICRDLHTTVVVAPPHSGIDLGLRAALACSSLCIHAQNCPLHALRSMHSPICRLPVELLCEVFLTATSGSVLFEFPREGIEGRPVLGQRKTSPQRLALIFSHVCALWRDISRKQTELWRTIEVVGPYQGDIYLTRLAAELSAPRTLSIVLHTKLAYRPGPYPSGESWRMRLIGEKVFDIMVLHTHRWKKLYIHSTRLDRLETLRAADLTCLEEVSIYGAVWGHITRPFVDAISHAPRLHTLALHDFFKDANIFDHDFTALRAICIGDSPLTILDCFHVLERCDRLEHFRGRVINNTRDPIHLPILMCQFLRKLEIGFSCDPHALFDALVLPGLESLFLEHCGFLEAPPMSFVPSLFERCKFQLREFTIRSVSESADECVRNLLSSPVVASGLQKLEVFNLRVQCSDRTMQLLTMTRESGIMPRLRALHAGVGLDCTEEAYMKMVKSRWSPVPCPTRTLRQFNLRHSEGGYFCKCRCALEKEGVVHYPVKDHYAFFI